MMNNGGAAFRPTSAPRRLSFLRIVPVLGILACASGCQLLINPYVDELAARPAVTTLSADGARTAEVTPRALQREYAQTPVCPQGGMVTHGPLYFEDPFEDQAADDGHFAWNGEEYLYFLYGPGRFLLNGAFFPVSTVVTPPWLVMASDGHPSCRAWGEKHDAQRWKDNLADE